MEMTSVMDNRMAEALRKAVSFAEELRDLDVEQFNDLLAILEDMWYKGLEG